MEDLQTDLNAIRSRKLNLIYIFNNINKEYKAAETLKATLCSKLVSEFKYNYISFTDCLNHEITNKTKIGLLWQSKKEVEDEPFDLGLKILIKHILNKKGSTFIIDWSKMTIDQALYIENNISETKTIIHLCKFIQINESNNSQEAFKSSLIEDDHQVTKFYRKFGNVTDISLSLDENKVFSIVKENLLPEVFCIIGKPYSGKTTISKYLSEQMNGTIINFNDFLSIPEVKKMLHSNEFVIGYLIKILRESQNNKVIIEDFTIKKEYFNLFAKNAKKFFKLIYLECSDFVCFKRMNLLDKESDEYLGTAKLNKLIQEYDKKIDILNVIKEKNNFLEIDANRELNYVKENILAEIQPKIYMFKSNEKNEELKNSLKNSFINDFNFEEINVTSVFEDTIKRGNKIGKGLKLAVDSNHNTFPNSLAIEMLRGMLFNLKNDKYILTNYSSNIQDMKELEEKLCKISKYVYVDSVFPINISSKNSIETYFKQHHRLHYYTSDNLSDIEISNIFQSERQLNIVYGLPLSGKKKITDYLANNYGFKVLDFVKISEGLKKKLAGPEGNPEEIIIDFNKFHEELKLILKTIPLNQKIIYQNIFSQIKDVNQLKTLLPSGFKKFFKIICNEQTIFERMKTAGGESAEALTDEQKEEAIKSWDIHKEFIDILESKAEKVFQINNTSLKDNVYTFYLDKYNRTNIIIIKQNYELEIEDTLTFLSATHRVLIVNVPELLFRICQDSTSKRCVELKATYGRKKLKKSESQYMSERERIYYEYNPIHFSLKVVNEIIKEYISENSLEIEDTNNTVVLIGYFNNDLLASEELSFNLPLLEIQNLTLLGNIHSYIEISKEMPQIREEEIAIELEQPKPMLKKVVNEGNAEGDGEVNEENKEPVEEEENKEPELNEDGTPKIIFHPEKYKWTFTDGKPRNYLQHLTKLNRYEVKVIDSFNLKTLYEILSEIVMVNVKSSKTFANYLQDDKVLDKDIRKPRLSADGKIILLIVN